MRLFVSRETEAETRGRHVTTVVKRASAAARLDRQNSSLPVPDPHAPDLLRLRIQEEKKKRRGKERSFSDILPGNNRDPS